MAGYKQTVLDSSPIAFWTFDEDTQSTINATGQIFDEIGNANPATVNGIKYTPEIVSLVQMEISNQYSFEVGTGGDVDNDWSDYNTYLSVPHVASFVFTDEFTFECMFWKKEAGTFNDSGNPGYLQNLTTPIIMKGDLFYLYFREGSGTHDKIEAQVLNNTHTVKLEFNTDRFSIQNVFERPFHVVARFKVVQSDVSEWTSTLSLFVNGFHAGDDSVVHASEPDLTNTDSILIGSTGGSDPKLDYATEQTRFDQIAVYDYSFTDERVVNHYKKVNTYETMLQYAEPWHLWEMSDTNTTMVDSSSSTSTVLTDGTYYGNVVYEEPGPSRIGNVVSVKFNENAVGHIQRYLSTIPQEMISIDDDYSVEMWFKTGQATRGLLFSMTSQEPYWNGVYVWINSADNALSAGNVQVAETFNNYLNSTTTSTQFNDNQWHHVVVTREGSVFKLYLDGELENQSTFGPLTEEKTAFITLMGSEPGKLGVVGNTCYVVTYKHALQSTDVKARWGHTTRYRVSGYTLYQGAPIAATVRIYDTVSGELAETIDTDGITGEFNYYPFQRRYLDLLSKIPDDNSVRYRAHGPIFPAEYDDSHLN